MCNLDRQLTVLARTGYCLLFVFGMGLFPTFSFAQTSDWTNSSGDGVWYNANNWDPVLPSLMTDTTFDRSDDIYLDSAGYSNSISVRPNGEPNFFNSRAGSLSIADSNASQFYGASSFSGLSVQMGPGQLRVYDALSILAGTEWISEGRMVIGNQFDFGLVVVDGQNSKLQNSSLYVGDFFFGDPGALLINNEALVESGFTRIVVGSTVGIHGGEFNVGRMALSDAPRVVGSAGLVTGEIFGEGGLDLSTIADHFENNLDWTRAVLCNSDQLTGATVVDTSFDNDSTGEVDVPASPALHFLGCVDNRGIIRQASNGILQSDSFFVNEEDGLVILRGQLICGQPVFNSGTILFDGDNTSIRAHFANTESGLLQTNANKRVTFYTSFFSDGLPFETPQFWPVPLMDAEIFQAKVCSSLPRISAPATIALKRSTLNPIPSLEEIQRSPWKLKEQVLRSLINSCLQTTLI